MIYFANPSTEAIRERMRAGELAWIATPFQGNVRPRGIRWCADNGCFNDKKFSYDKWWAWLERHAVDSADCVFATAPDVLEDHAATLERSRPWLKRIRQLSYPAAFVAQDGAQIETIPWDEFDVLFIGGSTDWKLGPEARALIAYAKSLGMWVHCGRVNSGRRYRLMATLGVDSADGTFLVRAPDINLPRMQRWLNDWVDRPELPLFREGA